MNYYVYALIDPRDGLPFYVGKGKGNRWRDHLTGRAHGENKAKDARINEIRAVGLEPNVKFLFEELTEDDAYAFEILEIEKYGRRCVRDDGLLLNILAGGEGHAGAPVSLETRIKLSEAGKGKPKPEGFGAKLSMALKGKKKPPEHSTRMSELHSGKTISQEQREMISKRHKGKTVSAETRAKQSAAIKAYWANKKQGK